MNFTFYIHEIQKETKGFASPDLYEKDLVLSTFLSNWSKVETPHLDNLIFKGGTLLTKNYLEYHRISEDLDFIHKDSNQIRKIQTKGKQETQIKNRIIPIIDEIKHIADKSKLEFETNRHDSRYVLLRNSRRLYIFNMYYKSKITKLEDAIKIEISFTEDLINEYKEEEIKSIFDLKVRNKELFRKITDYDLKNPTLKIYSINEIILEKIRAIITREQFKQRDVFDLFLINKATNIFNISKKDMFKKIDASPFQKEKVVVNIKEFIKEEIKAELEEIKSLSLVVFDEEEYTAFFSEVIAFCKKVAQEYLEK